ncbi:hypothetical protein JGR76_23055 [Salmonella enterica subsp. enterica serovar Montevideo]|nr:hypothetical protein [Salmonella enterica subsp. enterica serovar Montevideo]
MERVIFSVIFFMMLGVPFYLLYKIARDIFGTAGAGEPAQLPQGKQRRSGLMNPLMIFIKIIKLRWIHILSYDQMVSRKINNQTTRCANSIFYTTLFTNSAPNYT